mmetsp:Transcript_32942/g.70906  ORF Transcript_32942/g.70906 Transcript_32942/m.70906 type:complete len:426 (-) Transcript_32942:1244-2521(-)
MAIRSAKPVIFTPPDVLVTGEGPPNAGTAAPEQAPAIVPQPSVVQPAAAAPPQQQQQQQPPDASGHAEEDVGNVQDEVPEGASVGGAASCMDVDAEEGDVVEVAGCNLDGSNHNKVHGTDKLQSFAENLKGRRNRECEMLAEMEASARKEASQILQLAKQLESVRVQLEEQPCEFNAVSGITSHNIHGPSNAQVREECGALEARLARVRRETQELEQQIPTEAEAAARESAECDRLRAELHCEQRSFEIATRERDELQEQLQVFTAREAEHTEQASELAARNAALLAELKRAREEHQEATKTTAGLRTKLKDRNARLLHLRTTLKEQAQQVKRRAELLAQAVDETAGVCVVEDEEELSPTQSVIQPQQMPFFTTNAGAASAASVASSVPSRAAALPQQLQLQQQQQQQFYCCWFWGWRQRRRCWR